ncbi:MAG: hypothetical protein ACI9HK_005079 [Pirellulaceae bacterium]|jgi:hypothetical protein
MKTKLALLSIVILVSGCSALHKDGVALTSEDIGSLVPTLPSHDRDWQKGLGTLPTAEVVGDEVKLNSVRNCRYRSEEDFDLEYYDATYKLSELESVDFVVVPFTDAPNLAHTMLSFGFRDGRHFIISVEARMEVGEAYNPVYGALNRYELIYVIGDERDLIPLRTRIRNVEVYLYRGQTTPEGRVSLLLNMLERVNTVARRPEFYDTFTNNCTTNLVHHVNEIRPGRVPFDYRILLPAHSDRLAFDIGLIDTSLPFEELRRRSHINGAANRNLNAEDFSQRIRRHLTSSQ